MSALPAQEGVVEGVKYDGGKRRFSLLPLRQLLKVVDVLEHGAKKYAPDNWRKVPEPSTRYFDAAMRHLSAWRLDGEIDEESKLSHLAHAVCCCLFLMYFDDQKEGMK